MRVPLLAPLTKAQAACALLLANGHNYSAIGARLGTGRDAAKVNVQRAAKKIPGNLPAQMKVVCWVRGATREVLEGVDTNECLEELISRDPVATG